MKVFGSTMYLQEFQYPSRRMPVYAARGVVATSEPLAAQAGLAILQRGGNAVDAAIATAAALTVVEPTSNGIGSDAFALIWDGGKLHGLNGSGRAPLSLTPAVFAEAGHTQVPAHGWLPVTVPGAPAVWRDLHGRFGHLPFEQLFEPAIHYAAHGFPVGPETAHWWSAAIAGYAAHTEPEFAPWFQIFAHDRRAVSAGELRTLPDHAETLSQIARSHAEEFYYGSLAERMARFAAETGGYLTEDDLARHTSTWVEPIAVTYRDHEVWEIPPNGQGIAALIALNILEGLDLPRYPRDSTESFHLQIEAMKLAFADAHRFVGDMEHGPVPVRGLLDKGYARKRGGRIGERALRPEAGEPDRGGTVYLCAADQDGLMVSFIQSNYMGFGSGVVIPGTGIALQNRGACFTLEAGHPNSLAPGKRPFHTIIPSFLTQNGAPVGPFGVMGGAMQPQGHLQMVVNQLDYGMNPQTSLDAPRWQWMRGLDVEVELGVPAHVLHGLAARGHQVTVRPVPAAFGRGQIIRRMANGVYVAGSEPRADGCAAGW